jgi:AcrR family transcriptional regulator
MATHPPPPPAPSIWLAPPPPARRPGLDREQIVGAAVEVADEGGVTALTMAAVSAQLGSYTAMALYRYVGSKDGLIDLMLDQVTGEVVLPDAPGPSWRADLRAIATSSWSMVMRHRWYAQLVHARPPLGPNMLRRTEAVLGILTRQGATLDDAMTYAALLDRHVFGGALEAAEEQAMLQRYGLTTATELAAAVVAMRDVVAAGGAHPLLSQWMASPATATPDEQFELSLTFLLDGIARRLPRRTPLGPPSGAAVAAADVRLG